MIKKYKAEISITLIFILITGLNIYNFINENILMPFFPVKGINSFLFWYYVRTASIGEILLFLSPIFIIVLAISYFHKELASGIYKDIILKIGYKKYIIKKIFNSYIKGVLLIPIISLITYVIGYILFSDNILIDNNLFGGLPIKLYEKPYLYLFGTLVLNVIYSIVIINMSLIVQTKIKKFYLIIIITFLSLFFISNIAYLLFELLSKLLGNELLFNNCDAIGIYQGYIPDINITWTYISLIIWLILTSVILYKSYSKKQRIFDVYE